MIKKSRAEPSRLGEALFYLSAAAAAFMMIRLLAEPWRTGFVPTYPDSFSYLEVAARGIFRPFDERPVVYPTFLWLMGGSVHLAVVVQSMVYVGAFLGLMAAARTALSSRVAAALAIVLFGALAVQPRFALWNLQILTESLAISLAIASISAWWLLASGPTPRRAVWAWFWTILWLCIRDAHVMPVLLAIVPTSVLVALFWKGVDRQLRVRLLGGALVTVAICGWIYVAQDVSNRNQYPFHNNIGVRILADKQMTEYFVQAGMPLDEALRGREGHFSWDDNEAFLRGPELEEYRRWAEGPGGRRFLLSLVVKAPYWINRMTNELPNTLADDLRAYDTFKVADRLPSRIPFKLGGPQSVPALVAWTVVSLAGLILAGLASKQRRHWAPVVVFAAAGLGSAFIELYCSYAGDSLEVPRHLVGPSMRLNVMMGICLAVGVRAALMLAASPPQLPLRRQAAPVG
ncbi:MAG: hypothetical protein ACT4OM_11450 [Actinomycetota bacterium]